MNKRYLLNVCYKCLCSVALELLKALHDICVCLCSVSPGDSMQCSIEEGAVHIGIREDIDLETYLATQTGTTFRNTSSLPLQLQTTKSITVSSYYYMARIPDSVAEDVF